MSAYSSWRDKSRPPANGRPALLLALVSLLMQGEITITITGLGVIAAVSLGVALLLLVVAVVIRR